MAQSPRLLDQVKITIRKRHMSYRTEQAYLMWIKQYIRYHKCTHPKELGPLDVEAFLSHLAVDRNVAPSTQNQALNAIAFLYTHVQQMPLGKLHGFTRAKSKQRVPVVFSPDEVRNVLSELNYPYWLLAALMYGSGLRLMESLRLRVKDIDFHYRIRRIQIVSATQQSEREKASCDSIATNRSGKNEWHQWNTIRSSPVSNDIRYTRC